MPEEPDIEKTLRASAKRRREEGGAAPELHPATRKIFHDEIARLNRTPRAAGGLWLSWLRASPARLAMSLACLVALIFLGSRLVPRHVRETAKSGSAPAELAKANAPFQERMQFSPGAAPVQVPESGNTGDSNLAPPVGPLVFQSVPPATTPPGSAPDGGFATAPASRAGGFAPSDPTVYKDPAEALATNAPTKDTVNQSPAANLIRRFNRLNAFPPLEALTGSNGPSLFRSLRVEQNGGQLSVTDESDGSVYTGHFTNAAPVATTTPPPATDPATSAPEVVVPSSAGTAAVNNVVPVPNYSFSVSGTNRTLNQLVVLTGTVGPNNGFNSGRGVGGRRGGTPGGAQIGGFGGGGGGGRGAAPGGPGGGGFGGNSGGVAGGGPGAAGGAAPTATANSTNLTAAGGRLTRGGRGGVAPAFQLRGTVTLGTNQFPINAAPVAPN